MLDRTNHHFSGRSPILFFNSGILTSLFWYTAIAHGKTMAWDCFLCHQPLCLRALTFTLFDVIHTGIFVFQWIDEFENYILVIGLKFFQKLLRLRCSLMNSAGKSPCRYILMYNGSFTCLTMSEVLEAYIYYLLLNQNDKKTGFRLCL
jgi:hypothetical protein